MNVIKSLSDIFNNKTIWICFFLFSITLTIFLIDQRYDGNGDLIPNKLLPISILNEGDFDLNEFFCNQEGICDTTHHYSRSIIKGRFVSNYPIIPGVLNTPVYAIASFFTVDLIKHRDLLSAISAAIISSFSVILMFLIFRNITKKEITSIIFSLVYAFATLVWSVASQDIWQHGPSLLLINITIYILLIKKEKLLPWAGFFIGMAVFNRPTNFLIALPITIYFFLNHRKLFTKYLILILIPAFLLSWYSFSYHGSIWALGQARKGIEFFRTPLLTSLAGILISPARGLFVFSPIFLFSLLYFPKIFKKKEDTLIKYLFVSLLLTLILVAKWTMWWGGWSFGYRLIIETIPIWMIFLVLSWEKIIVKNKYLIGFFLLLTIISVYFNFLGTFYFSCGFNNVPNNIDKNTERLWQVKDTQLIRCNNMFFDKLFR
ncbi:glycosyltransferase family 39 protein [Patescibacteria group bacterium]|nr:glycosyltransferase family 39 protein [Patescibacteria group bacterium]